MLLGCIPVSWNVGGYHVVQISTFEIDADVEDDVLLIEMVMIMTSIPSMGGFGVSYTWSLSPPYANDLPLPMPSTMPMSSTMPIPWLLVRIGERGCACGRK